MNLTLQIDATAWLVSKEGQVHTRRWHEVLGLFFKEVRVASLDEDWFPSGRDWIFSTPLDTVSLALINRFPLPKHVAISNALDIMQHERFNKVRLGVSSLMNARDVWVDTDWAVQTLRDLGIKNVSKIPWGMAFPMPDKISVSNLDGGPWLLVPRLGDKNLQPEIVSGVLQSIPKKSPWTKIITVGMPATLAQSLRSRDWVEFLHMPVLQEDELLSLMAKVSAVLMAPKTDGVSVTMLQALYMGKAVLSTPTTGATEWSKIASTIALSDGFSTQHLYELLVEHTGVLDLDDCEDAKRAVLTNANLVKNVQARLSEFKMKLA